jgi:glucuronoarabinoxylan endo-1,4-beta-xylanase
MANVAGGSAVAKRAYVLGQYAKFVRPGYYRIDATRQPQTGVSVSAFQDTPSSTLDIIATNYTGSPVSQTFNITNAPTFSTLTPTITSASLSLAAQSNVSVSGNSFTYTLPADSITTFVGRASIPLPPTNLTSTVLQ